MIVFLNGKFLPYEQAVIPISTHALHYGTGCFEGIRGYWNEEKHQLFVFRLEDHIQRLKRSCQTLHMSLPNGVENLIVQLLKKNSFREGVYIRPLVYKKDETVTVFDLNKLSDGLAIFATPLGHYLNVSKGIGVIFSKWQRVNAKMIPPGAKPTGLYLNTALAKTQAANRGADEAILLNADGSVSEGSAENLFYVLKDQLFTPSLDQNILEGVTRNTVIEIAQKELGLRTIQKRILPEELSKAEEIFLTGTGAEVTPVADLEGKHLGVGKITKQLQKLYFDIVHGKNPKYSHWLTEI